jgi:hypothetical protein
MLISVALVFSTCLCGCCSLHVLWRQACFLVSIVSAIIGVCCETFFWMLQGFSYFSCMLQAVFQMLLRGSDVVAMEPTGFTTQMVLTLTGWGFRVLSRSQWFSNVADVEFRCCRHVMLGVVSRRRRGGGLLMFGCCTRHESQHGHNIVATWGEEGEEYFWCWMLHTLLLATCHTQTRNIDLNIPRWMLRAWRFATWEKLFATFQKWFATFATPATWSTADTLPHLNRAAQDLSDASARIRRPGASSSGAQIIEMVSSWRNHVYSWPDAQDTLICHWEEITSFYDINATLPIGQIEGEKIIITWKHYHCEV